MRARRAEREKAGGDVLGGGVAGSSGADRAAYMSAVALTACKFQDDPHNQKITHSSFEEYAHNSTHLRDRLLLVSVRLLAGWPKMPGERDCYARYLKEWMN